MRFAKNRRRRTSQALWTSLLLAQPSYSRRNIGIPLIIGDNHPIVIFLYDRHPTTQVSVFIRQYHSVLQATTDTSAKIP